MRIFSSPTPFAPSPKPCFAGRGRKARPRDAYSLDYAARVSARYGGSTPVSKRYGDILDGTLILNTIGYRTKGQAKSPLRGFLASRRERLIQRLTTPALLSSYRWDNPNLDGVSDKDLKLRAKAAILEALAEFEREGLMTTQTMMGMTTLHLTEKGETAESLGQVFHHSSAAEKERAYRRSVLGLEEPLDEAVENATEAPSDGKTDLL